MDYVAWIGDLLLSKHAEDPVPVKPGPRRGGTTAKTPMRTTRQLVLWQPDPRRLQVRRTDYLVCMCGWQMRGCLLLTRPPSRRALSARASASCARVRQCGGSRGHPIARRLFLRSVRLLWRGLPRSASPHAGCIEQATQTGVLKCSTLTATVALRATRSASPTPLTRLPLALGTWRSALTTGGSCCH